MGRGLSEMQWVIMKAAFTELHEDLLKHKIPQHKWFKVEVTTLERPWEVGATLRAKVRERCYGGKKLPRGILGGTNLSSPGNSNQAAFNRAISRLEARGYITRGRGTGDSERYGGSTRWYYLLPDGYVAYKCYEKRWSRYKR